MSSELGLLGVVLDELAGPKEQVVAKQLHNERGVFVELVLHVVKVLDGLVECRAGHGASLFRVLHDFVIED